MPSKCVHFKSGGKKPDGLFDGRSCSLYRQWYGGDGVDGVDFLDSNDEEKNLIRDHYTTYTNNMLSRNRLAVTCLIHVID